MKIKARPRASRLTSETIAGFSSELLTGLYANMLRIRRAEEAIAGLVEAGEIICPCHLYVGQEAVASGVCASLTDADYVYSTHRSHGHYLAKGGDLNGLFAELYGKAAGCSGGHGGSMHLAAPEIGFPGSSAIVAGTIPLAVGTALAFDMQKNRDVVISFFGDGAATEGVFYESLNLAALKGLPVVFVCENNFYSTHMHLDAIQSSSDIFSRAAAFGMPSRHIDGNNVMDVYAAAKESIDRARRGEGPSFIECVTYRWRGHVGPKWDVDKGLRSQEEIDLWVRNCPIERFGKVLLGDGVMTSEGKERIAINIDREIEAALEFAGRSDFPGFAACKESIFGTGAAS